MQQIKPKVTVIDKIGRSLPHDMVASQPGRPLSRQVQRPDEDARWSYTFLHHAHGDCKEHTRRRDILGCIAKRTGTYPELWDHLDDVSNDAGNPTIRRVIVREAILRYTSAVRSERKAQQKKQRRRKHRRAA